MLFVITHCSIKPNQNVTSHDSPMRTLVPGRLACPVHLRGFHSVLGSVFCPEVLSKHMLVSWKRDVS